MTSAPIELSGDQRLVLQLVYDYFWEHDVWPTFGQIDYLVNQTDDNHDAAEIIQGIDIALLQRGAPPGMSVPDNQQLCLTIEGMAYCDGSEADTELFISALGWLAELRRGFVASEGSQYLKVTSEDAAARLDRGSHTPKLVRHLGIMLSVENWGGGSMSLGADHWEVTVAREVRDYRGVGTLDDYLSIKRSRREEAAAERTRMLRQAVGTVTVVPGQLPPKFVPAVASSEVEPALPKRALGRRWGRLSFERKFLVLGLCATVVSGIVVPLVIAFH